MKKTKINYLIIFSICFVIAWLSEIFYFNKNDFDIEFREKGITTATIFNFDSYQVEDERHIADIEYIEYFYVIDGIEFKYGSDSIDENYSVNDKIEIEYVKSNPVSSRIKGIERHKHNFFIRNLMMVSIFSFLGMLGVFYAFDHFNNRDTGWRN